MNKQVAYWINSAEPDFEVAEALFVAEKYDWCLFIAHLVLELKFYKLCTKEFATENFLRIKELRKWLLQKIYR